MEYYSFFFFEKHDMNFTDFLIIFITGEPDFLKELEN